VSEPRKHHYAPVCYLRQWANTGDRRLCEHKLIPPVNILKVEVSTPLTIALPNAFFIPLDLSSLVDPQPSGNDVASPDSDRGSGVHPQGPRLDRSRDLGSPRRCNRSGSRRRRSTGRPWSTTAPGSPILTASARLWPARARASPSGRGTHLGMMAPGGPGRWKALPVAARGLRGRGDLDRPTLTWINAPAAPCFQTAAEPRRQP
jgi:hypothetical protein